VLAKFPLNLRVRVVESSPPIRPKTSGDSNARSLCHCSPDAATIST
jgi:hypothetical protein